MPIFATLITAAYHLMFLVTPFVFTWVNSELFQFNKMLFVYLMAIVVGSLWLMRMVVEKRLIWKKHPLTSITLFFLATQLVATLLSVHWRTSLLGYYSRLNGGFLSSLAYAVLLLGILNHVPKKQRLSLLLTNLVAAALISLYAIPESLGVSPSCVLMFQEFNVDCWKQDVQSRVFATFGQPNWLATYLVTILPISWFFIKQQGDKHPKLWKVMAGLMLLALYLTKSRSGLIGVGVIGLTYLWFNYRQKLAATVKKWFKTAYSRTIVGFTILGIAILISMAGYRFLFPVTDQQFDLSQGTESASIRLIVWRGAAKVWARYPWFGSGPGTFGYTYYQDKPASHNLTSEWDNLYNKAHSEPLNYLAETGILGLAGYLTFLLGALWLLAKKLPPLSNKITVPATIIMSIMGLTATNLFGFSTVTTNLLFFTLPALGLLEEENTKLKKIKLTKGQWLSLVIICLLTLMPITGLVKIWQADYWYEQSNKLQTQSDYVAALAAAQRATDLVPKEPLYYDELANVYAKLAIQYALAEDLDTSRRLGIAAIQNSDYALTLNPWQLNFYKTRVRVFFLLAQLDSSYYTQAESVLKAAINRAPTDAQLWYNLGITQQSMGKFEEAIQSLEYAIELRPIYVKARTELGDLLVQLGRIDEGKQQYQYILDNLSATDELTQQKLQQLNIQPDGNDENSTGI